eukprot:m.36853 g.36853  ORF g.36853 m.36853 type:complete len:81 (-) comp9192_c1_seq1:635-877(-)
MLCSLTTPLLALSHITHNLLPRIYPANSQMEKISNPNTAFSVPEMDDIVFLEKDAQSADMHSANRDTPAEMDAAGSDQGH